MHVRSLRNSKIERRSEKFVPLHRPTVPKYKHGKASTEKKTNERESTFENRHFGRLIIGCFTFSTAAAYLSSSFSSFFYSDQCSDFFALTNIHFPCIARLITAGKMSMHILVALNSVLLISSDGEGENCDYEIQETLLVRTNGNKMVVTHTLLFLTQHQKYSRDCIWRSFAQSLMYLSI